MYLIKLFDAQSGDMDSVECAESFDDALAWLREHLGTNDQFVVRAECAPNHHGGKPDVLARLEVELNEVVLAVIEDSPPVIASSRGEAVDATNALFDGESSAILALFRSDPARIAG